MALYDVSVRFAADQGWWTQVDAGSTEGAYALAQGELALAGLHPDAPYYATVRRHGRRRGVDTFGHVPSGGPDPAGVREPRRPSPPPPALRRELPEPG